MSSTGSRRLRRRNASKRQRALTKRLEEKSLFAVFSYSGVPELVSRRLGCVVHQPEYAGVDLAALCLKGEGLTVPHRTTGEAPSCRSVVELGRGTPPP